MAMENNESKLKYDYFDVTADIGFYAYGKSLEEAYENAGLAMFNVITDIKKVKKQESKEFEIVSEDLVSLLYDYLEELLFLQDTEFLFFSDFKVNIEAVQSGTGDPSPTNVRPITGWTGCNVDVSQGNVMLNKTVSLISIDSNDTKWHA